MAFGPVFCCSAPSNSRRRSSKIPFPEASSPDLETLRGLQLPSEKYELRGEVFYLHAPDGIGRSKLAAKVERCLGVPATGRNYRTVAKLAELVAKAK